MNSESPGASPVAEYVLVPKESTKEMLEAAVKSRYGEATYRSVSSLGTTSCECEAADDYRAMLRASPLAAHPSVVPSAEAPKVDLPRELMESCLAAAQEATFEGFDDSVLKAEFADPKRRRLMETLYRMGFESGWRIREQQASHLAQE